MRDIKELSQSQLEAIVLGWGLKRFYAGEIFQWIFQKGIVDFSKMSNLPRHLREKLLAEFRITSLSIQEVVTSKDGTEKLLLELSDGNVVEAVIIPTAARVTICISSQVGCKFACRFCASGLKGFQRDLTVAEIIDEVLLLKNRLNVQKRNLTHVVFMGTGEPLDNYDTVLQAVRILNDESGFHIGARRITISTCGIIPGIKRLSEEGIQVELSISLHAADELTREKLMPVNHKYPLKDLIETCKEYVERTNRQITFEYILLQGLNADLQTAQKLGILLQGVRLAKVNLIPANYIPELGLKPPAHEEIHAFKEVLLQAGIHVTVRASRGEDIEAACGQLRLRHETGKS
ncbi:MAG TPA: 23S rRNA (adenine(2503)-C(2))-methyltransferase RlmN [Candidatus Omnitrophota bacterium]|nr:23S rRNA (adenine(2503)-C(2))-methyltransferase RlmN [Candidatus Omnitrophota bacterium]HPT07057.1 23S rRNA (adenine(2503)-C(2))-methyltransferase RlmN [Candidatus Omnitrophota bacterium]